MSNAVWMFSHQPIKPNSSYDVLERTIVLFSCNSTLQSSPPEESTFPDLESCSREIGYPTDGFPVVASIANRNTRYHVVLKGHWRAWLQRCGHNTSNNYDLNGCNVTNSSYRGKWLLGLYVNWFWAAALSHPTLSDVPHCCYSPNDWNRTDIPISRVIF